MKVLGINLNHISSAALLIDGEIVSAACQERFSRKKMTREFPYQAIEYVLEENGLTINDIDAVSVPINPSINMDFNKKSFSQIPRWFPDYLYLIPNNIFQILKPNTHKYIKQQFVFSEKNNLDIYYINHHLSHSALAYYLSKFTNSAIFSFDGFGERTCTMWAKAEDERISVLQEQWFPHSLGYFYEMITEFLGFQPDLDEWKVMGMAAYGDSNRYIDEMSQLIIFKQEGKYELELSFFNHYNFDVPGHFTPKLAELLGKPRFSNEELEQRHFDIAASAQVLFEKVLFRCLEYLHSVTGESNLCVTGGSAMNCLANGKIQESTPFENVFVPYAPDDSGLSIGGALYVFHEILNNKYTVKQHRSSYLGPQYTNVAIEKELNKYGISYIVSDNLANDTVEYLTSGKVVAWFQGKMEFGQRALGNRSILADPRNGEVKEVINSKIKYRESYRPFAPAVLKEKASLYFEMKEGEEVDYMEKAFRVRKEKQDKIPAAVHNDGTGRLQTVDKRDNPLFFELIKAFEDKTGIPILINTSFNIQGSPIVCTPGDALKTFFTSGLDVLVIGDYIIKKGVSGNS